MLQPHCSNRLSAANNSSVRDCQPRRFAKQLLAADYAKRWAPRYEIEDGNREQTTIFLLNRENCGLSPVSTREFYS